MYWNAGRLKEVPVWAFHGDIDHVVLLRESQIMVDKTNAFGGNAKLTVYENTPHNAWEPTFNNIEVFNWLLSNVKKSAETAADGYNDVIKFG